MHLIRLSEFSDIYNFQDTTILYDIFENRAKKVIFPYNPQKCNSPSSLSSCIHRFTSKGITALPTQAEVLELFEKTLIGGFTNVNMRLAFDSIILLPKNSQGQYNENLEAIYKIKNEVKNIFEDKGVVTKTFKMNGNNLYSNAMTKPLVKKELV